jgi:GABA permease
VQNPLEHEEAAFRIVLYAIAYFAPIVVASWIASWLGFVVFLLASAVVVLLVQRGRRRSRMRAALEQADAAPSAVADTRRIVVVANETLGSAGLSGTVIDLADGVADDVVLVCPVPETAADAQEEAAAERLRVAVEALTTAGVRARGTLVRAEPLTALEDALGAYGADEVVLSTFEAGRSAWLDEGVLDAVRARFDGPVTHVVETSV